jgi:hypothetical protein
MTEKTSITPEALVNVTMAQMGTSLGLDARFRPALQVLAAALLEMDATESAPMLAWQISAWLMTAGYMMSQITKTIPGLTNSDLVSSFGQALRMGDIDPALADDVMQQVMQSLTHPDPGKAQQ